MLKNKPLTSGKLSGTIFDAPEIGDVLPMHNHTKETVHLTIICRGSFKVHGDDYEMTVHQGDVIDWQPGQAHEFMALEPNSRFVNIVKG